TQINLRAADRGVDVAETLVGRIEDQAIVHVRSSAGNAQTNQRANERQPRDGFTHDPDDLSYGSTAGNAKTGCRIRGIPSRHVLLSRCYGSGVAAAGTG